MILIFMGKSGAGKDYKMKEMITKGFEPIIPCTTRPKRRNEIDGSDYIFLSDYEFDNMKSNNLFLETRGYKVLNDMFWKYATPKVPIKNNINYVTIATPENIQSYIKFYGRENLHIVYLLCDEGTRKMRALARGDNPKEWERRVIADNKDFSIEKLYGIVDEYQYNN